MFERGMIAFVAIMFTCAAGPAIASAEDCLGLTCAAPGSKYAVPAAETPTTSVEGPGALLGQRQAGFYEYGLGTVPRTRAVAFVVPLGQRDAMPDAVRSLPVVASLERTGDFDHGPVVIFDPGASLSAPAGAVATRRSQKANRKPKARAAAPDAYGCDDRFFCLYDGSWFTPPKVQFGPFYHGEGWKRLGNYAFNDRAQSMRNRRGNDSLLARHWPAGSSTRYCADSHSSDTTFGNNPIGDNEASSFANVPDDIHC